MRFGKVVLTGVFACASITSLPSFAAPAPQANEHAVKHAAVCPGPANAGTARCHAHVVVDDSGNPQATSGPSGYGATDLRSAYSVAATGSSAITIAIVDAYGYPNAEADLAKYRSQFSLPACTTANGCFRKIDQRGGTSYPRADTGWSQETALDLDMASAMCPNCRLLLVEADSNSFINLATAVNTAVHASTQTSTVHAVSNSYGGGESGSATYEPYYNAPGVAVTVSSGDNGYGVEFPASSPHVIAVGGTSLRKVSGVWGETAWSGSGSGCSAVYAKPFWQTDAGCADHRTVADVSAVADPNTGVAVYGPTSPKRSAWTVFGGTSASAPLIAGLYGVNGGIVEYGRDPYNHIGSLHDVTSGSNGNCGGTYLCTAGSGYDGPTGLGTPNGVAAFGQ